MGVTQTEHKNKQANDLPRNNRILFFSQQMLPSLLLHLLHCLRLAAPLHHREELAPMLAAVLVVGLNHLLDLVVRLLAVHQKQLYPAQDSPVVE